MRSLQEILTDYALDEIYKNDEMDSEEQNKETVRFIEESNHSPVVEQKVFKLFMGGGPIERICGEFDDTTFLRFAK